MKDFTDAEAYQLAQRLFVAALPHQLLPNALTRIIHAGLATYPAFRSLVTLEPDVASVAAVLVKHRKQLDLSTGTVDVVPTAVRVTRATGGMTRSRPATPLLAEAEGAWEDASVFLASYRLRCLLSEVYLYGGLGEVGVDVAQERESDAYHFELEGQEGDGDVSSVIGSNGHGSAAPPSWLQALRDPGEANVLVLAIDERGTIDPTAQDRCLALKKLLLDSKYVSATPTVFALRTNRMKV